MKYYHPKDIAARRIQQAQLLEAILLAFIKGYRRRNDVFGHVSEDGFMLLMPCAGNKEANSLIVEIQRTIERYNRTEKQSRYEISLSIGYSTKESNGQSMEEIEKIAEGHLKHHKLLNQKSSHHAIVSSAMATLYAKSQETEEHGQRLTYLTSMIGEHLDLEQKVLDDLQLLSLLHDIGKIGIDDRILNKPDKLTNEEWKQMKHHTEIGYRIAMSTPQLKHIAECILHHHERWDGTGYPKGLKGAEIPLLSRVLAVADAYDAMTEDRIYRRALSWESSIEEIEKCTGTQFDPDIARLFVELVRKQKEKV